MQKKKGTLIAKIKGSPVESASYITAFLAEIAGGICAVYLYIQFLLSGGYGVAIEYRSGDKMLPALLLMYVLVMSVICMNSYRIKVSITTIIGVLLGIDFAVGTILYLTQYAANAGAYYSRITGITCAILLEVSLFLLLAAYVKNSQGIKKILMPVMVAVVIILCQLSFFYDAIRDLYLEKLSERASVDLDHYEKYVDMADRVPEQMLWIGFGVFAVCLLLVLILFFKNSHIKKYIKHWVWALVNVLLVIPAALAALEIKNIAIAVGISAIVILICGLLRRCPSCGRLFAMRVSGTELIEKEDINITVENEIRNSYGKVIGTEQQRVAGVKERYHVVFQCRHCRCQKRKEMVCKREKA